ncbi:Hypothetical predicted protein [Lecanosticta acicola]|uniref:Uncharacterized protein n=1 Tax=Lecanosticta acicola TaxID=111012 RepID=A0AAI9EAS0_9PEZI|nr:Hypothetical predicted protein [Lecanosticta acicola]
MPTLTPIEAHFQRLDDEKASGQGEKAKDKAQLDEYRQCFDASRGFEDDKDWLPQLSKATAAADAKVAKAATKTANKEAQLKKQALNAAAQKWSFDTMQAASQAALQPPPHHPPSPSPSPPKLAQSKAEAAGTALAAAESRHRYLMRTSLAYRQSLGADRMRDTDSDGPSIRSQPDITNSYPYQDYSFMRQGMDAGRDGLNNRPDDDTQSQASSSYYSAASNGSGNESKRAQAGYYSSTMPAQALVTVHPPYASTGLRTYQYHYPQPGYRQQSPTRSEGSGHAATSALNAHPYAQAGYSQQNPTPAEAATTAAHNFNRNRDQSSQPVGYSGGPHAQHTSPLKATTENQSAYNNLYPQTGYYDGADAPYYFNGYSWSGHQP